MALFGITPAKKVKKAARLALEARGLAGRDAAAARRKLDEGLALLRSVPGTVPGRDVTMADTLVALANIERISNNVRAIQLLEEAVDLGVTLSDSEVEYLANEMARAARTDVRAIDACVVFAAMRAREPNATPYGPEYELLERSCFLNETTPAEERATRINLCSRLIALDKRPGFPYYFRGKHSFLTGDFRAAMDDFHRSAERGFVPPDLNFYIKVCTGYGWKDSGRMDEAAYCFVEAAKQNPSSYVANYEAGSCLVELCRQRVAEGVPLEDVDASRRKFAIALLTQACEIDDRSASAYFLLGCACYLDRRAEDAASAFHKAVTLQPRAAYFLEYARALRRCRAAGDTLAAADEALRLDPDLLQARWLIASISMRQRDFHRAAREYRTIAAALPAEDNRHRNAVYGLGICCFELCDHESAIDALTSLERQDLELSLEGRLILARSFLRRGDLETAESRLADLVAAEPEHGESLYFLGCCQARQGRFEEAIATLTTAESAGAAAHNTSLQRGLAYEALGMADRALTQYEKALESKNCTTGRLRAARLYWKQGRHEEAMAHLRRAEPTPDVLAAQAELYALQGNRDTADAVFWQAAAIAPDRADIRRRHGAVLLNMGETERAEEALRGREQTGPDPDDITFLIGVGRLRAGDPEGALALWEQLEQTPERDERLRAVALQAARRAREAADYDCALALWDRAIHAGADASALRADRARAMVGVALQIARSGGAREDWEPHLRRALAIDSENPDFVCLGAALDLLAGEASECAARIENFRNSMAAELQPPLDYLLGLSCLRQGSWARAEGLLRAAMADGPEELSRAARVPCAAALAQRGRWSEAAELLAVNPHG